MRSLEPYLSKHRLSKYRFDPARSALLVIDMQRYFLDESSQAYLPDGEAVIGALRGLIEEYRSRGLPVIFTKQALKKGEDPLSMGRWWKDNVVDGDPMSAIDPRLEPRKGEKIVRKSQYSAFVGTSLGRMLRARKISQVLITGVMTHLCCESTARDAFMRGFDVFIAVDGTASRNRDLHISSLKTLADGFAIPVTVEEVTRCLRR